MPPTDPALAETIEAMQSRGIDMLHGRWLIEGGPHVLLIDTKTAYGRLDEWRHDLWTNNHIPCPPGDDETNEAVAFGYLVAWFLGEVRSSTSRAASGPVAGSPERSHPRPVTLTSPDSTSLTSTTEPSSLTSTSGSLPSPFP